MLFRKGVFAATAVLEALVLAPPCVSQQQEEPRHSITYLLQGKGAFVRIPPGQFTMGSDNGNPDEQPRHTVRITRAFEMGRYEVTQAQWRSVMEDPHARPQDPKEEADEVDPSRFKGPELPVESVSWYSVQRFLRALNIRDPRYTYRLPTEAEWEYAAAAGKGGEDGWCESNSGAKTHPGGQKPANRFGLHDMIGNVTEWVQDWYGPEAYAENRASDPQGPAAGSYKVYRGGAWLSPAKHCRATYRAFDLPNNTHDSVGFRLVRVRRGR